MKNDLISRQAAIDALDKRFDSIPMNQTTEILLLRKDLRELPPAQPETTERTTETAQNVSDGDLISRKAAIDALRAMQTYKLFAGDDLLLIDQAGAQTELMMLPSAQPERKREVNDGQV